VQIGGQILTSDKESQDPLVRPGDGKGILSTPSTGSMIDNNLISPGGILFIGRYGASRSRMMLSAPRISPFMMLLGTFPGKKAWSFLLRHTQQHCFHSGLDDTVHGAKIVDIHGDIGRAFFREDFLYRLFDGRPKLIFDDEMDPDDCPLFR
jgi:hypothetical protein